MNIVGRILPFLYGIVAFLMLVFGTLGAIFLSNAHTVFLNGSAVFAYVTSWISAVYAVFYVVALAIQLAMLDLHNDDEFKNQESIQRIIRTGIMLFCLALVPVGAWGVNARYEAQVSWGVGFLHEGSLVYFVSVVFMCVFFLFWSLLHSKHSRW